RLAGGIASELCRYERPALIELAQGIRRRLLLCQHFIGISLGVVLRTIAKTLRIGIVVPTAPVAGYAVHDLEMDVRVIDADAHELSQIARTHPDRETALVGRQGRCVADPNAEDFHRVLIRVQAAELLAEHLGQAVTTVRLWIDAMIDLLVAAIKAGGVIAGGEQHTLDAVAAR